MKRLKRIFTKTTLSTIVFFLVSAVSLTFAWFAYTGTAKSNMELEVLAWHISFDNESTIVNFTTDDIKPGMNDYTRDVIIENKGDVKANDSYDILKLRVLDDEYTDPTQIANQIDTLPFTIDISLSGTEITPGQSKICTFEVTWQFESGNDSYDTLWGEKVNTFKEEEKQLHESNSSYVIRKPLELEVQLNAVQSTSN